MSADFRQGALGDSDQTGLDDGQVADLGRNNDDLGTAYRGRVPCGDVRRKHRKEGGNVRYSSCHAETSSASVMLTARPAPVGVMLLYWAGVAKMNEPTPPRYGYGF